MFEENQTRLVYSSKNEENWRSTLRGPQFDKKECEKVFKEFIREKYPYHAEVWDACKLWKKGFNSVPQSEGQCPAPLCIARTGRGLHKFISDSL